MENNFGIPCYGHKIIIPSNKSPGMKKNLTFSLMVLFTVFAGTSGNTAYQSLSHQYKTFCINNNKEQKQSAGTFGNLMADKLMNEESCGMVICLSHPGYQYAESNKVSDEIPAEETNHIDLITGGHTHTFFDNPMICKNKKGNDIMVNQVGWSGIVLDRLNFEFTKFSGKNWQNIIQFLFHKKQEGKNFFLEKNC